MEYYDLKRNWRRVSPHLSDQKVADTLVRDFNKFTYGRWKQKFLPGMVPHQFESCDWYLNHRGRMPAFWQYTKHAACHWLVNFSLELAQASVPDRLWCIQSSPDHSTVWDGHDTLFDFNFQAMGLSADECFQASAGTLYRPGQHLPLARAFHYTREG